MAYSDTSSRKRGCIVLLGLVALILALPAGWLAGRPYTSIIPRSFNSQAWKEADGTRWPDDNTRCSMIADLRLRVGIEGKTQARLLELLGPDDSESKGSNVSHWHLCPSFMDIWILEIRWKDGKAEDAWVRDT